MKRKLTINKLQRRISELQYRVRLDSGKDAFKHGYHVLVIFNDECAAHCCTYKAYKQVLKEDRKYGTIMITEHVPNDFDLLTGGKLIRQLIDDYDRVHEDYEDPIDKLHKLLNI